MRISVTFPTPGPPTKLPLKYAANAKPASFNRVSDRKKKAPEVEKAYINCKDKLIPVKKTKIKKTTTTVFLLDL